MAHEIPIRPWTAAEKIQAQRAVLGERMAGDMRLSEDVESSDAAGAAELRPLGFAARMKVEIADDLREERLQRRNIAQEVRRAAVRLHDPFDARHLRRTFEVAIVRIDWRLSPIQ